jgi:AcrR family transcriptional regulator
MPDQRTPVKRTPKWKRRPESRPDEILSAAIEVFGEAGLARAKLDDVARKAGVSKGTLYLYFDSKEELFRCVVQQRIASCFDEAERRLREFQGSSREMLEWFLRRSWETIRRPEMVQIARMVNSELANFPDLTRFYFDAVILRNRALLNQVLDRGLASGEFRAVPNDFVIRAVPSLLLHGAIYQRGFGRFDPHALTDEQVIEGIVDLVLHGVMARKES